MHTQKKNASKRVRWSQTQRRIFFFFFDSFFVSQYFITREEEEEEEEEEPFASTYFARQCTIHHNENDSQDLVNEKQDAPPVQKRPEHQKKADERRVVPKESTRAASDKELPAEKRPKPKQTKLTEENPAVP